MDCGVLRRAAAVLVPAALSLATIPLTGAVTLFCASAVTKIVSSAAADACGAKGSKASAEPSNNRLAAVASALELFIPLFLIFILSPAYLRCVSCNLINPEISASGLYPSMRKRRVRTTVKIRQIVLKTIMSINTIVRFCKNHSCYVRGAMEFLPEKRPDNGHEGLAAQWLREEAAGQPEWWQKVAFTARPSSSRTMTATSK